MVVRGVPHRIAKDAWWLDDCDPPKGVRAGLLILPVLLCADLLILDSAGGLGFAVWVVLIAAAVFLTVWRDVTLVDAKWPIVVLVLAVLPLVEVVQFSTVMVAMAGLGLCALLLTGPALDGASLARAMLRFPFVGLMRNFQDMFALRLPVPDKGNMRGALLDWALPVGVGGVFVALMLAANPVLDRWMLGFLDVDADFLPSPQRVFFWVFMALASWPFLRVAGMRDRLIEQRVRVSPAPKSGLVNARSVSRALVLFNLIFAVQTFLDLGYLWGGFALPEGMTYANYAHRGAYPLLATALLAGAFALIAQPFLGQGKILRVLLYVWIGQTLLLVLSSILRLDLYVDVYGLTRLRVAAFVWMVVVAGGLGLIVMQLLGQRSLGWFIARACGIGAIAIYGMVLSNVDGLIARHNLANGFDDYYVCGLSEGAAPAIRSYEARTGQILCGRHLPFVATPDDWREWGYRNARVRRSLAALEEQQ